MRSPVNGLKAGTIGLGLFVAALLVSGGALLGQPSVELATGLSAATGVDLDETNNHLYFVEWSAGTLKRMVLTPGCEAAVPPTCATTTVATGFSHPQDVAVDAGLGVGYVTTRDDTGTTGALWRVDLGTGTKSLVTFNLEAPHQIALDPGSNTAYVVGFDGGRLWSIDLTTGVKLTVASGLDHPIGLVVDAGANSAYVTEQGAANRLVEFDLTTGAFVREVVAGLTAPFYLEWTDPAETALYLVERDPANQVQRVDLVNSTASPAATGLPFRPSGAVTSFLRGALYVTTNTKLVRVDLAQLPMGEPVFLGVGHVPSTEIDANGYATTASGYFFRVTHAPFGGTLNILGNLNNFKALGATHYRVLVSDGGPFTALDRTWNAYRWNPGTSKYELTAVAPLPGDTRYEIPPEYPSAPQRWYPSFLMMRWPSSTNGLYTFQVELWQQSGSDWNDLTHLLPTGNTMTLRIDNTPPTVDIRDVLRAGTNTVIAPCEIVSTGANLFDFRITAFDTEHHLLSYTLSALWGKNRSAVITSDSYTAGHVDAEGPYQWSGLPNDRVPPGGWSATCNCAHTFRLRAWKRTINGYNHILHRDSHQSITINNTGAVCP